MQEIGKASGGLRRAVANWAKKTGLHHNRKVLENSAHTSSGYSYPLAKKLVNSFARPFSVQSSHVEPILQVFSKVKANLGLDRCRISGVGAAPMAKETFEYFLSLDIPIYECYGMSETSGPQTGSRPGHHVSQEVRRHVQWHYLQRLFAAETWKRWPKLARMQNQGP